MNKTYLIGGVAVVAVLIVVGFMMKSPPQAPETPVDATKQVVPAEISTKTSAKHSLKDFLGMSNMMKCTFANEDATSITEGVTYTSGGKVRSDTKTTIKKGNTTMTNSSIIDSGVMYAWGSSMPQGIKMELATMEGMKSEATTKDTPTQATDFDTAHDYDCDTWSADVSVFVPPADVTFVDYSEMMKKMMGVNGMGSDSMMFDAEAGTMEAGVPGKVGNTASCALCEQVVDIEAKTQCKIAMGCS